ncbi:TIGR03751 family conjugal transfer lipoprotein [Pasteurella oralis]|uniref:TIGR03751 family conjugal transfer lipoprotein n=1 Tax=Pasteurella oralis TaxID=1071947 RepID=UPI000C7B12A6|nr:TIGR03751 family conjugal transfer lipoprotein [Pasteurella oralis]
MKSFYFVFTFIFILTGCATSQEKLLPTSDKTMADIWKQGGGMTNHIIERQNTIQLERPISENRTLQFDNASYTRDSQNEVKNLFPRLPNPDLVMYVFPHLTNNIEPVPIPGYTTVFPFYGRTQYAQPGERTRRY